MSEEETPPAPTDVKGKYRSRLGELRDLEGRLGLEERPDDHVVVDPGVADPEHGRPVGAKLPVYSKTGTDKKGIRKAIFNLFALTGVDLTKRRRNRRKT
ncbi:MAG: hypothetical protein ACE5DQ_01135 [Candidatus Paceibacterota bacterium]